MRYKNVQKANAVVLAVTIFSNKKCHRKETINFAWQKRVESLHRRPLENPLQLGIRTWQSLTVAGLSMICTLFPHKCDCFTQTCKLFG